MREIPNRVISKVNTKAESPSVGLSAISRFRYVRPFRFLQWHLAWLVPNWSCGAREWRHRGSPAPAFLTDRSEGNRDWLGARREGVFLLLL